MIALNQATSPGATAFVNARSGKVSANFSQWWQIVLAIAGLLTVPLTVARPSFKKPFVCKGFMHLH
jgi:hypothetical protein